jgi:hypothetical protein
VDHGGVGSLKIVEIDVELFNQVLLRNYRDIYIVIPDETPPFHHGSRSLLIGQSASTSAMIDGSSSAHLAALLTDWSRALFPRHGSDE